MAYIGDDDIDKVREATDLAAVVGERVVLKPKGRDLWGCCPFHNEKTPSFKVDPQNGFWHCFGCGEGGDAFGFVMKLDGLSFPEAVRSLAERAGIEIAESESRGSSRSADARAKEACAAAESFYHTQLMRGASEDHAAARAYLSSRSLGGDIPRQWMLGYAPGGDSLVRELGRQGFTKDEMLGANLAVVGKNGMLRDRFFRRVMFPIHDASGACIAFGGRVIGDGEPKYLNSQETRIFHKSKVLYGLDKAKAAMASTGTAIVTEGYTDVIAMHAAGLTNTVATLGTALTTQHVRQLARQARRRIVYLFDGDEAGQRATERALRFIAETISPTTGASTIDIFALSLPDGQDPADFLASHGPDEMRSLIEGAKPLILYGIERRLERRGSSTPEERARALADALDVLAPIKDTIIAKDYAMQVADMLGYRHEDVMERLGAVKAPAQPAMSENAARPPAPVRLTAAEANRRAIERELLALCCQHPVDALANAEGIERIGWHESDHERIAARLLGTLMEDLTASMGDLMLACEKEIPGSSKVLTGSVSQMEGTPAAAIRFMIEELRIADLEQQVEDHKRSLDMVHGSIGNMSGVEGSEAVDAETDDRMFESMVELQAELAALRSAHSTTSL